MEKNSWNTLLISIGLFLLVYVFLCYLLIFLFIYISFFIIIYLFVVNLPVFFCEIISLTCSMFAVLRVSPFSPSSCFFFIFGREGGGRTARYKDLNILSQDRLIENWHILINYLK